MASAAISAFGTLLQVDDGAAVFTTVAELLDITGPGLTAETADVTNHASPGAWREMIPTMLSQGTIGFDVNYVPTSPSHNATVGLVSLLLNRTKRTYKLIFPSTPPTNWQVAGYVTSFSPTAPVNGQLRASTVVTPAGAPTLS
jgi:Lambda phage tail tube protein, TTP